MKLTISKVRQSDFMQEHGIQPMEIREIREKHLEPGDWWKEGAAIFWSQAAAARVEAALFPSTPQTDEQDEEGQPAIQGPIEAPVPLPEVPTWEETREDAEPVGSDPEPVATPEEKTQTPVTDEILTVRVLKRARNYRYVYASLDGERVSVLCPKKGRKNIVGKAVRVKRETIEGATQYTLIP